MSNCKSCGAPVRWVLTEKGKRMPLDAKPSEDGRFWVDNDEGAHWLRDGAQTTEPLYTSHFATCPNADEHRKVKQ